MKKIIGKILIYIFDVLILWSSGWKKKKIKKGVIHYLDPITGDYWLKDIAVSKCEWRIRNYK